MRRTIRAVLIVALASLWASAAAASDWRPLDPENTLMVETSKGRIVVEMRPDFAPMAVARIKQLAREHFYDGLLFHRVIDHFMDQTGNPNNHDGGVSGHPDLAPEFSFRLDPKAHPLAIDSSDAIAGFVGASPFEGEALTAPRRTFIGEAAQPGSTTLHAWGAYCPGVAGMGREEGVGTANSEIFFMRDAARRLDHDYTVWGRVVAGLEVVRAVNVGEPPAAPDRMIKVSVMADLPAAARPKLEVLDADSPNLRATIAKARAAKGADFSICDIDIPTRHAP